jgi:diketogulonate reductase-like aldo/keto reductase
MGAPRRLAAFWPNRSVRALCEEHGIAFQAYGPLSGGAAERAAKLRGTDNPTVRQVAASAGRTPAQVLLRWARLPGDDVALPLKKRGNTHARVH